MNGFTFPGQGAVEYYAEIWVDQHGRVVRYNLAYINHLVYAGDNGRVLGYDSAHGHHHRHYRGNVTTVQFESFKQIEACFLRDCDQLTREVRHEQD